MSLHEQLKNLERRRKNASGRWKLRKELIKLWEESEDRENLDILRYALFDAGLSSGFNLEEWMEQNVPRYYELHKIERIEADKKRTRETLRDAGFDIP